MMMMLLTLIVPVLLLLQAAPATPAPVTATDPAPGDWRAVADDDLMVVTLAGGHRVVIRLAPGFAPEHVANIRRLARQHWWDGLSVYRVQENWVAQWGDPTEKKPLPADVAARPAAEYEQQRFAPAVRMTKADAYSDTSGITADGWPVASDGKAGWLTHCYGSVGVARDASPDTGTGAELFTPIGQSARRLDRNYTVVGRIIDGMQYLSALPRSDAPLGIYASAGERMPIVSVRLASDIPAADRPHYQYRAADNPRFAAMVRQKESGTPPTVTTGAAVCDIPLQVRPVILR